MDPPRHEPPVLASPPSTGGSAFRAPAVRRPPADLPGVHERLARPGTPEEYFHGEPRLKMPAKPPHARQHLQLGYVLGAHVAEGWLGAVEMLTRTGHDTDFAPDASVYPAAPDPKTGERQIEHLAFEICSQQNLSTPTGKARDLVGRGVRRVFCIVVGGTRRRPSQKTRLLEWSRETDGWSPVAKDAFIEDPCLSSPLPVRALLDATQSDDAVARALRERGNPIFEEERAKGEVEASARILLAILETRGLDVSRKARRKILECNDVARLERWVQRALDVETVDDLWD